MPVVTSLPIQLSYFVADIATALLSFNRLRWHRSRTGKDGLYEPATAAAAGSATLLGTAETPHQINGKTLSFRVNGTTTVDVTFSDSDPVSTAQAAAEIAGATGLVTATDDGGHLRLTTVATGSGASIEILESDAAPYLGLAVGAAAVGTAVDTTLVAGTHEYFFTDQNSDDSFWYRVEFYSSTSMITTGLGVAFPANSALHVPKSQTIVCYIRASDMHGNPIEGRRVTFHNMFLPNRVSAMQLRWGVLRHNSEMITDRNGYAEIRLLRGMQVDYAIDGTNLVRRITIPLLGDSVDLMDPTLTAEDEFGIQEPNIDFAVRTS